VTWITGFTLKRSTGRSDWTEYVAVTAPELKLADAGRYAEAWAAFDSGRGEELGDTLKDDLKSWRALDVTLAREYSVDARRWAVSSLVLVAVLLAAAIAAATYVGRILSRRLANGLSRLVAAADGIAAGDVDQRVDSDADDEIAAVARAFDSMVEYLNGMAIVSQRIAGGDLTAQRLREVAGRFTIAH